MVQTRRIPKSKSLAHGGFRIGRRPAAKRLDASGGNG